MKSLDLDINEYKQLLNKTNELVLKQYEQIETQKGYHDFSQEEVESWFDESIPLNGMDNDELLRFVEQKVLNTATGNLGPHMYAYVMSGGNQISNLAETLANTIDQNPTKWHLSPAMNEIEKRVIHWATQMIGYNPKAGGVMVSGGSAANLTGLTVARNVFFKKENIKEEGLFNKKPFTVYASEQVHSCIDKSVQILGIGTNQLRKIKTDTGYRIDIEALKQQIEKDISLGYRPFCVVGISGTVNTGAIDDLDALANIAQKHQMWFHIDGAYGGLASALDSLKHYYKGMERADSIALDFHKWLYQPFEVGCAIIKDWNSLRETYYKKAEYLDTELESGNNRLEFNEHYFQVSRNAKAFKVWRSLKSYGFNAFKAMIQKDIDLTHYLADEIEKSTDFELKATSHLAVVCFRYIGNLKSEEAIKTINKNLIPALEQDGRVFITGTKLGEEFVLRACLINHRKTKKTSDFLLNVIKEVGQKLE